ncbi:MAG: ABC transporter ATP-binding protein [Candidatus Saccharibacteria bacterium]
MALLLPGTATVFTRYVPPLAIAAMIRHFSGHIPSDWHQIVPYLSVLTVSWVFGEIIWRIAFLALDKTDARGMQHLYTVALRELLKKDSTFFNDNFAGSLTKKVSGYGRNFEGFMDTLAFNIFGSLLPILFAVVILWFIAPILVLVMVGLLALTFVLVLPYIHRRQKLVKIRETNSNLMAGHIADVVGNIHAVQSFAHEPHEQQRHEELVGNYMRSAQRSWDYHVLHIDTIVAPLYIITNVVGLTLAIMLTHSASALAAVFVTFNYFSNATNVLFEFNRIYRNIENAFTEAGQFTELLLEPPRLTETAHAKALKVEKGAIDFEHVDFAYADTPDKLLFADLNLAIPAGQRLALVGHSGGGKTSITKLLLRFLDVTGGTLKIDGQDISQTTIKSLRYAIAYVPQDPAMFHRSLRENIRYGRLDASDEEVEIAAKRAHAMEFIEKLPHGFDTLVGERGVKLSGGQRQRIAIARAMLKNAPILMLDEATSALDSESEALIQDALWKLMEGRTAIVIAHRLSTIQRMDRIVVLDNGKIVEEGSHKELVSKKNGTYAKLWARQSGGFIEE